MTVYSWGDSASIEKLHVKKKEAILYAGPAAKQGDLSDVPEMLRALGVTVIPDEKDGQHILRIRDFKSGAYLAEALEENGFAPAGQRQEKESPKEAKKKKSLKENLKEKSLKAAGLTYLMGDAALITAGIKRKDAQEIATGVSFSSTSLMFVRYGDRSAEKAFDKLYDKLLKQFARDGVEIPKFGSVDAKELAKPGGALEYIDNFLSRNTTQMQNLIGTYAGTQLFKAGRNQDNMSKSIAGVLVGSGMLTSLLVPEKSEELQKAKYEWLEPKESKDGPVGTLTSPFSKVKDWVQERPLRVAGYMAMGNNVMQGMSALTERQEFKNPGKMLERIDAMPEGKKRTAQEARYGLNTPGVQSKESRQETLSDYVKNHKTDWVFNMVAASAYFVGNNLLALTSKSAASGDKEAFEGLYATSAAILANQPEETRNAMIDKVAFFLAEQPEVGMDPHEIAQKMRDKVAGLETSPWLAKTMQQQTENTAGPVRA